jgi:D-alanyl-D-alanine carboxypeptidase (penicillin-binding protein 5/6)
LDVLSGDNAFVGCECGSEKNSFRAALAVSSMESSRNKNLARRPNAVGTEKPPVSRAFVWLGALCFALFIALTPLRGRAEAIQTPVPQVILIDAATQSVLFEKGADEPATPASTVKLMTAEIVFQALTGGKLKLDDEFTVSETAWRNGGAPAHGSTMFAAVGSRIRVEDLIRGLVVVSGNDAGIVLAEGLAGSEGAFATRMTQRGRELGLLHSTFTSAWGRGDPEQRVTARDMVLLAAHVIRTYPDYYRYFSEKDFTWGKVKQPNRNPLLTMDFGADGLKTGNIEANSFGIVASAVQNGQRLILALYGARTAKERAEEARRLLQWGFRAFEPKTLFAAGDVVGTAKVFGGASADVPLVVTKPVTLLVPRDSGEKLTGSIVYTGPLKAPVMAGQSVGQLKIFRGTIEILEMPLETAKDVELGSLQQRATDAGLEYAAGLIRKYVWKK